MCAYVVGEGRGGWRRTERPINRQMRQLQQTSIHLESDQPIDTTKEDRVAPQKKVLLRHVLFCTCIRARNGYTKRTHRKLNMQQFARTRTRMLVGLSSAPSIRGKLTTSASPLPFVSVVSMKSSLRERSRARVGKLCGATLCTPEFSFFRIANHVSVHISRPSSHRSAHVPRNSVRVDSIRLASSSLRSGPALRRSSTFSTRATASPFWSSEERG